MEAKSLYTLYLTESQRKTLAALGKKEGRSGSHVIRRFLDTHREDTDAAPAE